MQQFNWKSNLKSSISTAKINQEATIHLSNLRLASRARGQEEGNSIPFLIEKWRSEYPWNSILCFQSHFNHRHFVEDHDHYRDDSRSLSDVPSTTPPTLPLSNKGSFCCWSATTSWSNDLLGGLIIRHNEERSRGFVVSFFSFPGATI